MNPEQRAAFLNSQVACALAEIAGMQAENQARAYLGQSPAYQEDSFAQISGRYGIDHNSALTLLRD